MCTLTSISTPATNRPPNRTAVWRREASLYKPPAPFYTRPGKNGTPTYSEDAPERRSARAMTCEPGSLIMRAPGSEGRFFQHDMPRREAREGHAVSQIRCKLLRRHRPLPTPRSRERRKTGVVPPHEHWRKVSGPACLCWGPSGRYT